MTRILFAGTPEVAVQPLHALCEAGGDIEVVGVLTRPDAPQGRGRKLTPSPVKKAALELGLPVIEHKPTSPEFFESLDELKPDMAAVVAYGNLLKQEALDAIAGGWYNLHFSLLPLWRGAAPVQRAIWAGDEITGATVFRIGPGLDDGPILAQSTVTIGEHETSGQLLERLSNDGALLLRSALQGLISGHITPREQEDGVYEHAAKIHPVDARIRFDVPAFATDRQIRACTPEPGAWTVLHNGDEETIKLHVIEAQIDADAQQLEPGVLAVTKKHVWVGTATYPLELLAVKAQGKKQMSAADWARGARLQAGAYCE
ncbi:methionyl-tRNA formyltransferase [Alloscardovia theropitheci]|uniref:Methionyl-tRNA formyltransferase n=1 Tax=Alloscardovia theropitheci TaxID=2496842 RepID=A0A4R0R199_9BIFI|nr:methionyl-tRNA formyltransferase [Alloscardovia theropitheci]TCD54906.1 methionyl-tRNA formyltransferase [Alloscardovia theropitheci]